MTTTKQCSDCHEWKPATPEFFYRTKQTRDGLYARCKDCWNRYANLRKSGEIDLVRQKPTYNEYGMKQCRICKAFKPATPEHFFRKQSSSDGLQNHCKVCDNEKKQDWNHNNPEKAKEHSRMTRIRHPEIGRRTTARYRSKHRNTVLSYLRDWRKKNQGHIKDYNHDYRQANRHQIKIDHNKRRARKRDLPDDFTVAEWEYCLDYFNHCCAVCKRPLNGLFHKAAADHWIALSKGGGTTADNIIPLCNGQDSCNQSKHDRDAKEWLETTFGKQKAKRILTEIEAYFAHVRNRRNP